MTRALAAVAALLAVLAVYHYRTIDQLQAELAATRADLDRRALALAVAAVSGRTDDIARAAAWLHEYYKSDQGLKRPEGIWIDGHPDYVAISAWLFDVYFKNRVQGASDEAAKQEVVRVIQGSEEWKSKHPAGAR